MIDYKDTNPDSPYVTKLMQDQDTEHKSGPALIEKFVIRLPKGLRKKIKHLSENNRRSMNSEIIMVLEQHIQQHLSDSDQDLTDDIAAAMVAADTSGNSPADELTKRLQNLPDEKKQALLELLG
jgi:hypothetical protein